MAKNLDMLELKRMFKELEFYESDYEYVNEVVSSADPGFLGSVNEFLDEYPDLKDAYSKKMASLAIVATASTPPLNEDDEEPYDPSVFVKNKNKKLPTLNIKKKI